MENIKKKSAGQVDKIILINAKARGIKPDHLYLFLFYFFI